MVGVEHHHLRRAPRNAARLGRAGRLVEHLEEAHQARAGSAARQALHLAAQLREVRPAAGPVLEDARFVMDQVEDGTEIVVAALDEAGRNLWPCVGVFGDVRLAGGEIHGVVPARSLDPVLVKEAAVEPDGTVERADLVHQHVRQLCLERLRIHGGGEVAAHLLAGAAQGVRHAADQLPDGLLGAASGRNARLAEVLGDGHVGGKLGPGGRHFRVVHLEDDFSVRSGDLGGAAGPFHLVEHLLGAHGVGCDAPRHGQAFRAAGGPLPLRPGTGDGRACGQGGQGCGIVLAGLGHRGFSLHSAVASALRKCGQSEATGAALSNETHYVLW